VRPEAIVVGAGPAGLSAGVCPGAIGLQGAPYRKGIKPRRHAEPDLHVYPSDEKASEKIKGFVDEAEQNPLIHFYAKRK